MPRSCHRLTRNAGGCTPASSLELSHPEWAELGFLKGTKGTLTSQHRGARARAPLQC